MWNPLNYLGYGSSNNIPTSQQQQTLANQQLQQQLSLQKNTKIKQRYLIQQHANYHKHIKQFQQLIMSKPHNQQENTRIIKIFSQLILSLQQFMSTITEIKHQYEESLTKIELFDSYQRKIENHDNIIKGLMEGHQREIQTILAKSKQQQNILRTKLRVVEGQLLEKNKLLEQKHEQIGKLRVENEQLKRQNQQITKQLQENDQKYSLISSQLALLNNNNHNNTSLNNFYQKQQQIVNINNNNNNNNAIINLKNIIVASSGIAQKIFSYLNVKSILLLAQTNKSVYHIVKNQIPKVLYERMQNKLQKEVQALKNQSIYFNHILYDQLDSENTKINAIKYLFFNHKPGTYILSMFQQDITKLEQHDTFVLPLNNTKSQQQISTLQNVTTIDQLPQKKSWRNFFKTADKLKKDQSSIVKTVEVVKSNIGSNNLATNTSQQKFSLAQLKNSQTFKKIQQQLSKSFHQHVFSLKLPKDLQLFGKIMTEQFLQLRKELSSFSGGTNSKGVNLTIRQWTSKLLTLSKFLYLESQQLWTLSQSIFSKLMQFEQQNHQLRSQIDDMTQNQSGMRKLVQQLARNKIQMQKRIWQSQRKNNFLKSSAQNIQKVNEKLQQQIQSIRGELAQQQTKTYQLQKQLLQCKEKLSQVYKRYKQKMDEFVQIKEQLAKVSWI